MYILLQTANSYNIILIKTSINVLQEIANDLKYIEQQWRLLNSESMLFIQCAIQINTAFLIQHFFDIKQIHILNRS